MNIPAVLGAFIGAAIGATLWAVIALTTGYELGYVAWGIGALVGFGSAYFKGEGTAMGVICAFLALAAIFMGKVVVVGQMAEKEVDKIMQQECSRQVYDQHKQEADALAAIASPEDYPQYMISHGFSKATDPAKVTPEELTDFSERIAPILIDFSQNPLPFEEWQANVRASVRDEFNLPNIVVESLGPIDFIFGIFGIFTAFKIGAREQTS